MKGLLHRGGIGLLAGVVCGAVAFETVTILAFAAGAFGPSSLKVHLLTGILTGAVFGPSIAVMKMSWLKAAVWEAGLLCTAYFAFFVWSASLGPVFRSFESAVETLLLSLSLMGASGALAGACTAWSIARIAELGALGLLQTASRSHSIRR